MHVEEAEDLRLGIAEGVKDRAGFERRALGQIHHHLHADRPFALVVAIGQAELRIELPADRAHRPVAHHRQRGAHVHAGQEGRLGISVLIHALIGQADSRHPLVFDQRFLYRHSRPDLDRAAWTSTPRRPTAGTVPATSPGRLPCAGRAECTAAPRRAREATPSARISAVAEVHRARSGGWRRADRAGRPPSPL